MDNQIEGLPGWAQSEPYDFEAKVDAGTAEVWKKLSYKERRKQEQPMMQSLLADRCQLKVHRLTREMPVYDLVIAKGGLKMKEAAADEPSDEAMSATMSGSKMTAHAQSTDTIMAAFQGNVGRMIVDKTGLAGKKFDFELSWADDRRADEAADAGPSIFTAIEEQLGLKLVPAKGPVEVVVIDHIERPSPN
jgi:bla regulator protein blaR1